MRKVALAVLALLVAAGIAGAALWTRPPQVTPEPVAGAPDAKDEGEALTASKGLAWRDGQALNMRLKGGEVLTLSDRVTCGDLPCDKDLAIHYRYAGWDAAHGGYRLQVARRDSAEMILPYGDDDPILIDARHAPKVDGTLPQPTPAPAAEADESLKDWLDDVARGRGQSEAPLIDASRGKASRDGARLSLKLTDGRNFVLTDDLACGQVSCPPQVFRSFDYAGTSPDGRFHVVEERWDEASAAMLVDARTGTITSLLGVPRFSSDGKRAVATVTDLEWSAPRRLEVWTLGGPAPGIEFSVAAKDEDDTVYEVVGWDDSDHLRLRRGPWASDQRTEVTLVHDAAGWHMEGADAGN